MKREFSVQTHSVSELVEITSEVEKSVRDSGVKDGACFIYIPHTTAAVCINENADPSVRQDIENTLAKLVPRRGDYAHTEGNADAHIKASIIGSCRTLLIEAGEPLLGRWQGIYLCEFDGPRKRKVIVKILGS